MTERLVDVLNKHGLTVHTYPITLEDPNAENVDYERKALEAAAHSQLVPDDDLGQLTARMHTSRGGHLQPVGDNVDSNSEPKPDWNRRFASGHIFFGNRRVPGRSLRGLLGARSRPTS